jgi:ribosome-binding protein aMBF1 (putative translation factor)
MEIAILMTDRKYRMKITTFEEHLEKEYGPIGSPKRTEFEIRARAFTIGMIIKEERKIARMTQEELARRTGTKKSFISRIENGHSDIQISTLIRLIQVGLGKDLNITIG